MSRIFSRGVGNYWALELWWTDNRLSVCGGAVLAKKDGLSDDIDVTRRTRDGTRRPCWRFKGAAARDAGAGAAAGEGV
jgi:hypothetical protein